MGPIFYDTETVAFCGPVVLIQYALGDGPITLHEVWNRPFSETLGLIRTMMSYEGGLVGFNLTFDHFQLSKIFCMFDLFCKKYPDRKDDLPKNYINKLGVLEKEARNGPCLKPVKVCDVMIVARRGPYQSTMQRKPVFIKKVPNALAYPLAQKLESLIPLKDIYFAKRADKHEPKWSIEEIKDHPEFKNLILRFKPSSALKALAIDALGIKETVIYGDISLPKKALPEEVPHAPFALALAPNYLKDKNWRNTWPSKINHHIDHWHIDSLARKYAKTDVIYTRGLYKYFGSPELGDDDSTLTCLVGAARWRGYSIDVEKIKKLKTEALIKSKAAPKDQRKVRTYIGEVLSPTEKLIIKDSTKKIILEEIAKWSEDEPDNEAARRAQAVLDGRGATKEIENFDKLIQAGRFHASFNVTGALSNRMSGGGGGINPQGIKKTKTVRSCFPLSFDGYKLCGGDFKSFEVVLMDANYNDPKLREYLLSGKSIHGIFGTFFYPGMSYEDIMKTNGTEDDKYTRAKSGVFALAYGAEPYTLMTRLGVTAENAEAGYQRFTREFDRVGAKIKEIGVKFCSMTQANGIGSRVSWRDPDEFIESMYGFKRYFTLENKICKALFDLAEKPPKEWTQLKINVVRREREQTVSGAVRSALFAAAFMIQGQVKRAAINHIIQSSGATLTKALQRNIWEIQPSGINDWLVQPYNVHDEIMCPAKPETIPVITKVVDDFILEHKGKVPLLQIDWHNSMETWADK